MTDSLPAWLDDTWLFARLGIHDSIDKVTPLHVGLMSRVFRVGLRSGRCLVVKLSAGDTAKAASDLRSYEKELTFYREFSETCPVQIPAVFLVQASPFCLVMEDCGSSEASQVEGLEETQAQQVIDAVADLHAHYWGKPDRLISYEFATNQLRETYPGLIARHSESLGADLTDFLQVYLKQPGAMREPANTLIHVDVRADNLVLRGNKVTFLDWGDYCFGPAVFDLATLMMTSLTVQTRRENERQLIERYAVGIQKAGISYDQVNCWQDYRGVIPGALHTPLWMATREPRNTRQAAMMQTTLERSIALLRDHLPYLRERFTGAGTQD